MYRRDTIVARATPPGRGAIAIVRLSGDAAFEILDRMFTTGTGTDRSRKPEPWRLRHGTLRTDRDGEIIDEVLAVRMPGPSSYTGEDVAEIQCHGSPLICDRVVAAALTLGARPAERGEFTRRAVLNGRIDLVQAEAIADLIDSRMERGLRVAWDQLQGALSGRLERLRAALVEVLAELEAAVDFSDEELPEAVPGSRVTVLEAAEREIEAMLAGFEASRRWREGYRIVFSGRPNVGKSSLINALLGHARMIVTDEPGTTRDAVEEVVEVDGAAFVLTDTAGVRDAPGRAEEVAVERARAAADEADILVVVVDGSRVMEPDEHAAVECARSRCAVVVVNKIDLADGLSVADRDVLRDCGRSVLEVSAIERSGVDELVRELRASVERDLEGSVQTPGVSRSRHRAALERAANAVRAACRIEREGGPPEIASVELRTAAAELAAITQPLDNEEVLDQVFATFCIGK